MQENNNGTGYLLCEYPSLHGSYLRRQAELSPCGAQNDAVATVGQPGKAASPPQNDTLCHCEPAGRSNRKTKAGECETDKQTGFFARTNRAQNDENIVNSFLLPKMGCKVNKRGTSFVRLYALAEGGAKRRMRVKAFTLAEVLITLGIIGVVAAITLPSLIKNHTQKAYDRANEVFQSRMTEALSQMKVAEKLNGYSSTEKFISEFKKYIKTIEVCNSPKTSVCFAEKISLVNNEEFDINEIKTSKHLGHEEYNTNAVGMTINNGYTMIFSYNPDCPFIDPPDNTVNPSGCLSMIYDINGKAKPNKIGRDIFLMNATINKDDCYKIGGFCAMMTDLIIIPNDEDCSPVIGANTCAGGKNYWAGARDGCAALGMRLPTQGELDEMYRNNDLPNKSDGQYWSSSEYYSSMVYTRPIKSGTGIAGKQDRKSTPSVYARCVR